MTLEARIIIFVISFILALLVTAYFVVNFYVLRSLMRPKKREYEELLDYEITEKGFQKRWLDIPYEDMYITSDDGLKLHGKFFKCATDTNKIMLSLHGHNSCHVSQMKYLETFLELGYNVFMPDHRRSGESEGHTITFGAKEKYDTIKWIDYLEDLYPEAEFSVFGESMGAATAIMVTALDSRIKLLIEYCGYANMSEVAKGHVPKEWMIKFGKFGYKVVSRLIFGVPLKECDASEAMAKLKDKPVLMIHSKVDEVVVYSNALVLKEANPNAEFHTFEDTKHARSMVVYPEKFKEIITDFIQRNA